MSRFDEEPDDDVHGPCRHEIHRLEAELTKAREAGIREALAVIADQFCSADNDIEEARNLGATWCEEAVKALLTTPAVNPHIEAGTADNWTPKTESTGE